VQILDGDARGLEIGEQFGDAGAVILPGLGVIGVDQGVPSSVRLSP